jgi:hypothetical protein
MPNLGLGVSIAHPRATGSSSGETRILYSDSFIAWPNSGATFRDRQIFSSGASGTVTYGGGIFQQSTGASGRHALVYFNCDKYLYPVYNSDGSYVVDDQVYGGSYGHAIFEKTAGGAGAPIFLNPLNPGQDANGWTRVHPTLEPLEIGKSIIVSFTFRALSPGTLVQNNMIRFAILDSSIGGTPYYINSDSQGLTNALFGGNGNTPGYRGYMTTLAASATNTGHRIFTRTTTTSNALVNTLTNVWTERATQATSNLSLDVNYSVELEVKRTGSSIIVYTGRVTGGTLAGGTLSYTDYAPSTFVFDTLALDVISNTCDSFQVSNIKATYV